MLWRRSARDPEGAIPSRRLAKIAIPAATLCLVTWLAVQDREPAEQAAEAPAQPPPRPVSEQPDRTEKAATDAVDDATAAADREAQAAAARLREAEARQQQETERRRQERQRAAGGGGATAPFGDPPAPGGGTAEEAALRLEFRLEDMRRERSADRAPLLARTARAPEREAPPPPPPAAPPPAAPEAPAAIAGRPPPAEPVPADAGALPAEALPASALPRTRPRPSLGPGTETIDEGTILDAVLTTQIRGDFAGPVAALVATPLWSRDRQRVLIPRGSRALGSASAVSGFGQSRLAVGFDRLILPDGARLDLEFAGLSQTGAAGLQDKVNRHYLSTFGAAGAIGLLAGLSQRNAQGPTAFTAADARWTAGQRIGQAGEAVFERFLNRNPTLTIRAGHRLRIYLTSDVSVPRTPAALRETLGAHRLQE